MLPFSDDSSAGPSVESAQPALDAAAAITLRPDGGPASSAALNAQSPPPLSPTSPLRLRLNEFTLSSRPRSTPATNLTSRLLWSRQHTPGARVPHFGPWRCNDQGASCSRAHVAGGRVKQGTRIFIGFACRKNKDPTGANSYRVSSTLCAQSTAIAPPHITRDGDAMLAGVTKSSGLTAKTSATLTARSSAFKASM